jgi:ribosomal protein S10
MHILYKLKLYSFYKIYLNRFLKNLVIYFSKLKFFQLTKLPTKNTKFTVLRSPHINKKSKEQFQLKIFTFFLNIILKKHNFFKLQNILKFLNLGKQKKFLPLKIYIIQKSLI